MIIPFVGQIMREKFPILYKRITKFIFQLKKNNYIYISDYFGGSFKSYILENNMLLRLGNLQSNLDEYSIKTIKVVYTRILNYPEFKYKQTLIPNRKNVVGGLLEEEKIEFNPRKVKKNLHVVLDSSVLESSVFTFYHGLSFLPTEVQKHIQGKDFIDVGAYVGDSAIALKKFNYKKIYSIEMSKQSISEYKKNMILNSIPKNRYEIINCAVTDREGLPPIKIIDSGSAGLSIKKISRTKASEIEVELKTLNTIITDNNIKPAFIKIDVEGAGMECINGGLKSLKKFRPVLSIAIYHNPIEFFEVKPYLESELPNYIFMIRKLSNSIINNFCHAETFLLAYPSEII